MKDFQGKGAIVTGAASGIGLGIARALAKAGARVALADIEEAPLERARRELEGLGAKVVARRTDVSDRADMAAAAKDLGGALGKVHLVFNNAGVELTGPLCEIAETEWDWIIGVNLYGVINGIRHFVPLVRAHGEGGHIVNTASIAGFQVNRAFKLGAYAMTKYAVVALTEALEQDLAGSGIGVSILAPAAVNTEIHRSARNRPARFGGSNQQRGNEDLRLALQRGLTGDQVAKRVLEGIAADEFYIFTHKDPGERIGDRYRRILEAVNRPGLA